MSTPIRKGDVVWVHAGNSAISKVVVQTYPGGFKFHHVGAGRLLNMPLDAEGEMWCRDVEEDVQALKVAIALRRS